MDTFAVYDHPSDYPNDYVVRRWVIEKDGTLKGQEIVLKTPDLRKVREMMEGKELYCIDRAPFDDPAILETWI